MRKVRGEEEWARRCIERALEATVKVHDDGSLPGMFDLEIHYSTGKRGAVEVTAAGNAAAIELWNIVNSDSRRWIEPDLVGGWSAALLPTARARKVKAELPTLLRELEKGGIRSARRTFRESGLFHQRIVELGITHLFQGDTDYPGSIYLTIDLPAYRMGGMVPETGDPLARWLTEWLAGPGQDHNLRKLHSSSLDERHLFVLLPGFADASFAVTDLLMRDEAPLPKVDPDLPSPLTHVWCMSSWTSGAGMRWSMNDGWVRFEKLVDGVV